MVQRGQLVIRDPEYDRIRTFGCGIQIPLQCPLDHGPIDINPISTRRCFDVNTTPLQRQNNVVCLLKGLFPT